MCQGDDADAPGHASESQAPAACGAPTGLCCNGPTVPVTAAQRPLLPPDGTLVALYWPCHGAYARAVRTHVPADGAWHRQSAFVLFTVREREDGSAMELVTHTGACLCADGHLRHPVLPLPSPEAAGFTAVLAATDPERAVPAVDAVGAISGTGGPGWDPPAAPGPLVALRSDGGTYLSMALTASGEELILYQGDTCGLEQHLHICPMTRVEAPPTAEGRLLQVIGLGGDCSVQW